MSERVERFQRMLCIHSAKEAFVLVVLSLRPAVVVIIGAVILVVHLHVLPPAVGRETVGILLRQRRYRRNVIAGPSHRSRFGRAVAAAEQVHRSRHVLGRLVGVALCGDRGVGSQGPIGGGAAPLAVVAKVVVGGHAAGGEDGLVRARIGAAGVAEALAVPVRLGWRGGFCGARTVVAL